MTYKHLRRIALGVTAVGVVVVTGHALASGDTANFDAAQEADQHAATAEIVMTRGIDPVPAHDAAFAVVGNTGQTIVEGLRADGTNWDGHVILRITVSRSPGTLSSQFVVRCYRYTFTRYDAAIDRLECPPGPPLVRGPVKPFLVLTDVDVRHLAEVLDALSPTERVNAGALQLALAKAYAAPAVVWAAKSPNGIDMEVRAHTQCILATLPTVGPARVSPVYHGSTCMGG